MSRLDKTIQKWRSNTPNEIKKDEIFPVLDEYFQDYEIKKGSHIVVRDDRLSRHPKCFNSEFTIAIKNGRKIKGVYLKLVLELINYLESI